MRKHCVPGPSFSRSPEGPGYEASATYTDVTSISYARLGHMVRLVANNNYIDTGLIHACMSFGIRPCKLVSQAPPASLLTSFVIFILFYSFVVLFYSACALNYTFSS